MAVLLWECGGVWMLGGVNSLREIALLYTSFFCFWSEWSSGADFFGGIMDPTSLTQQSASVV